MTDALANKKLAAMLRESAAFVEQDAFDPIIYQALAELHVYAGQHRDKGKTNNHNSNNEHASETAPGRRDVSRPSSFTSFGLGGLGKKLGKLGLTPTEQGKRQATSTKNAERAKADLDELRAETATTPDETPKFTQEPPKPAKPSFQRPLNVKSSMIANGWIEQKRRSKMRDVWKDVLASLVEGRKPNEETTLWIQREVLDQNTGKPALEALHQIPIKWLEDVRYLDFYGDHRFSIKVYNVAEEFLFKCRDEESAQNWVLTLRSVRDSVLNSKKKSIQKESANGRLTPPPPPDVTESNSGDYVEPSHVPPTPTPPPAAPAAAANKARKSVKELRAIAHGAGINTSGMERAELERVVEEITRGVNAATAAAEQEDAHQREIEAARRREEQERLEEHRRRDEQEAEAQAREEARMQEQRRKLEEEHRRRALEQRKKAEEAAAEEKRRQEQIRIAEEQRRAAALLEEKRRAEEQRRAAAAEEQRRAAAAAEEQRRLEEHRRRVLEQQAAERKRQEDEQRRLYAEQQAAEQRRRQEEAAQRQYQQQQQQWQQQQWQQQQWQRQQQQQQWQKQQQQQQQQQQRYYAQQQQQQYAQQQQQQQQPGFFPGGQPQAQRRPEPPKHQASMASMKYAQMANQTENDQEKISAIKRNLLVHWALQPPMLQMLRPIGDLLINIHSVFPPKFGVAGHEYFAKWKSLSRDDVFNGVVPDEDKLKKAVRKLRFFLHPDKLPRDLNDEQKFMCKMLWDVSNDAWEEFTKKKEELDWIQK